MDRQEIERCLEQVAAYRASGQRASDWGPANGVTVRQLASWSAHAARWQARLDGSVVAPRARSRAAGFVAAVAPTTGGEAIRVEVPGASRPVIVHWPLSHARELAGWLRQMCG